jgi:hypothetical protein
MNSNSNHGESHGQQTTNQSNLKRKSLIEALTSPSNSLLNANKRSKMSDSVDSDSTHFLPPRNVQRTPEKPHTPLGPSSPNISTKYAHSPYSASKKVDQLTLKKTGNIIGSVAGNQILQRGKSCTFNDPIHGNIAMGGLCLRIIDTKEFQRLRNLKQLGTCDYVYPGATHSRFSHSIGVGYYAETLLKNLKANQHYLDITPVDILCVKVAGLCHDLGHGAYSHVFEVSHLSVHFHVLIDFNCCLFIQVFM